MRKITEQQLKHNDCGISAAKIIYNIHDIVINRDFITENISLNENGSSLHDLKEFFDKQEFSTEFNLLDLNSLRYNPEKIDKYLPCILPVKSTQGQHYIVVKSISRKKLQILDPAIGQMHNWSFSELMKQAYTATANYDYVANAEIFQQVIDREIGEYNIDAEKVVDLDKATIINKLTYFSYVKENFGFKDVEGEKKFLEDLLFNQEISTLPKQFKTLKLNKAKLRITAPVVLTIKKPEQVRLPSVDPVEQVAPVNPYKRLVREMKAYHKLWGIYIFSALFAAFIGQLTIFSSQILIDNILPNYNFNLLILFAVGLGVFRVFVLILSLYKSFISIHLANIFDNFFLSSFSEKLNSYPIRYIHSFSKGDLSERIKDSLKLKTFFIRFFTNILIDAFVTLYSLVILFIISWKITLIVLVILIIFIIWFTLITPFIRENEKRRFLEKSGLFSSFFENIEGLQVIKSFRLEGAFMQRLGPKIKSILNIQKRVRYVSLINSGVIDFLIIIAGILIIVFLSQQAILDKTITIGQIITFIALSRQVFSSVSGILGENLDLQENSIILERYFDFGKAESIGQPAIHKKINSFEIEKIEFRNVAFHYIPQRPVFTNLSLVINRGDKIQLEGNNGAGKSTFCKVLSLLYAPDGGDIYINNEKFGFYSTAALREKILLVSNEDVLFNDTLGFNISFNYSTNTSKVLALAKEVGLYDFISEKSEGLDFIINEQGRNLSTGQRKKILMMRAFLSPAELIIFDETLSGIDKESKQKIEEYINQQTERSFIVISHEPLSHLRFSNTITIQNGTVNELQPARV